MTILLIEPHSSSGKGCCNLNLLQGKVGRRIDYQIRVDDLDTFQVILAQGLTVHYLIICFTWCNVIPMQNTKYSRAFYTETQNGGASWQWNKCWSSHQMGKNFWQENKLFQKHFVLFLYLKVDDWLKYAYLICYAMLTIKIILAYLSSWLYWCFYCCKIVIK